MQYRRMGRSGLKLSEVAVGSWMTDLKGREACDTAKEVLRRAYNSGVNFFDCADAYSGGQAEVFLGNILKEFRRSSYVVSSKVFFPVGAFPEAHCGTAEPVSEKSAGGLFGSLFLPPV